jgi:hypothetical protein
MTERDIPQWIERSCAIVDTALAECANRETVSTTVIMDILLDLRILLTTASQTESDTKG